MPTNQENCNCTCDRWGFCLKCKMNTRGSCTCHSLHKEKEENTNSLNVKPIGNSETPIEPIVTPTGEWEREFDEKFVNDDGTVNKYYGNDEYTEFTSNAIKSFISRLLALQKEEIVEGWKEPNRLAYERGKEHFKEKLVGELEGMIIRKIKPKNAKPNSNILVKRGAYNSAIEDVIKKLSQ